MLKAKDIKKISIPIHTILDSSFTFSSLFVQFQTLTLSESKPLCPNMREIYRLCLCLLFLPVLVLVCGCG